MIRALYDRLAYAFIGFVLGAVLAAVLWLLYDMGFSRQIGHPEVHAGLSVWVKYLGGAFALIGFFFKDRVGSAIGRSGAEVYNYESGNYHLPAWLVVIVLLAVAGAVWYLTR